MLRSVLRIALERRGGCDPDSETERLMNEFETTLNRITVARYHGFLKRIPSLETRFEKLEPPKFGFLAPLARLPLVGELFTGTVVAVLCKRS
jgi:hypothetical protein